MASFGTIIARVYTSRAVIPVAGATVAVTRKSGSGKHVLIAVRVTDENGKTAPVSIATPDPSQSASPGAPDPFTLCDVWAVAEGYEMIQVEDVQIFPGTETVQNLELIPLPELANPSGRTEVVQITPQNL